MNLSDLRNKSEEELNTELLALLREQFNLRFQKGADQKPQTHLFKNVRRKVAQIKTILREKEGSSS